MKSVLIIFLVVAFAHANPMPQFNGWTNVWSALTGTVANTPAGSTCRFVGFAYLCTPATSTTTTTTCDKSCAHIGCSGATDKCDVANSVATCTPTGGSAYTAKSCNKNVGTLCASCTNVCAVACP